MSQWGQDKWVVEVTNGKRNGFFLDIGAGHAIKDNNTWLLESEYGWDGICVEPVDEFFQDIKRSRKCDAVQAAVGPIADVVDYFFRGGNSGIYDCFSDETKSKTGANIQTCTKLQSITMRALLSVMFVPKLIDYWSLDTEGSEWELIRTFPWEKHSVFCLSVEHNHEQPKRNLIQEFMADNGYDLIQRPECEFEDYYVLK